MKKMLIYGSCVSRDTKGSFPEGWTMELYVARQSILSATSGSIQLSGKSELTSDFQNRMLAWDFEGNGLSRVEQHGSDADCMLIDLIDERRGVWEVEGGKYITNSWELEQSKLIEQQPSVPRLIPFGTDEHFELWSKAVPKFKAVLTGLDAPSFVIAADWAERSIGGADLSRRGKTPAQWNALYQRYYAHLDDIGFTLIRVAKDLLIANEDHIWGLEPYHYIDEFYHYVRDAILLQIK